MNRTRYTIALFALTVVSHSFAQSGPTPTYPNPHPAYTGIITTVAGNGNLDFAGDGGPATSAQIGNPYYVALDSAGNLYLTGDTVIRRVDRNTGIITTYAGLLVCADGPTSCYGAEGYSGDGGPAFGAAMLVPEGIAFDSSDNLYIADTGNNVIRRVDAKTSIITTVVGRIPGRLGYSGDGGLATNAQLAYPDGIALDTKGNLYIADTFNNVIRKVDTATDVISTVAGGGTGCTQQTDTFGDGCPAISGSLNHPSTVLVDTKGNLYIADTGHVLVRKVDAQTGMITTIAGNGIGANCPQAADESGDGCPATEARLYTVNSIQFDHNGNLYISSQAQIQRVDAVTGIITSYVATPKPGVSGGGGYTGDGGLAINATVNGPVGMVFDSANNFYFADFYNDVLRKVTYSTIAAPPSFSPAPGTYTSTQSVILSDVTSGATIYYTIDGSTPSTSSPQYIGAVPVTETTTIQAIAVASGYLNSDIAIGLYTLPTPTAAPAFSLAGGTYPSTQTITLSDTTSGAVIYYTTDGSTPTTSSMKYTGAITVSITQTIQAIAVAAGYSNSAVASATYSIGSTTAAIPTFSPTPGTYSSSQTVTLSDATSGAIIYYTTDGSIPTTSSTKYTGPITASMTKTLQAIAIAAGFSNSAIASATYTIAPLSPAAIPAFTPPGGTYTSPQTITVTDQTLGATIYYTTDGSMPTVSSTKYTGTIMVNMSETIMAIAAESGYADSPVSKAVYTINLPAADFSVGISPTSVSVTPTQSSTATITVMPLGGFNQLVSFNCSGLPTGASCSFSPSTVTPSGIAISTTLTVSETLIIASANRTFPFELPETALAATLCVVRLMRRRRAITFAICVAVSAGLMLSMGCGGSHRIPSPTSTTSIVTITATSGALQHSLALPLIENP